MRTEDGHIIRKCLDGKPAAFGFLVDKYKASIYAFAYAELRNLHDAEDVTQEVFIKAYQELRTLKCYDSFLAWLYSITSNLCKMWLRAQSRRPDREFIEDQDPKIFQEAIVDFHREDPAYEPLHKALNSLPKTYRQVLMLRYFGGMNSREIARFLGTSPTAIRMRLTRARSQLKEGMLAMMHEASEQHRLQASFTFHIIEAIKRIKIHPMPRMTGLPWGLSLAAGIIFTVLSLNPSPDILAPGITSTAQSPGHAEMVRVGEIPVDVLTVPEEIILPGYPGELHGEDPGRLGSQEQADLSMAPAGQEEYTFVRSWPEELLGVRYARVSVDGSGYVYAADFTANRIQKFDSEGNLEWGTYGSGDGQFNELRGITTDDSGNVYAVDRHRVQKFDPDGNFLKKWGTEGSDDGQFDWPMGIAADRSGNVYVADSYNHRIQVFDSEGKFLMKWGTKGTGDGQFSFPQDLAVDSSGNVYVLDVGNYRIQVFDSQGNFLRKWGSRGDSNGQFGVPRHVALDASGNVYVADHGNSCIQQFDSQGNFLRKWGSLGVLSPISVAVDNSGNLYVTDRIGIKKYDSEGRFLKDWAKPDGFGQFNGPYGLAFDDLGNLYVADYMNSRIQKFGPDGNFLTAWGTFGTMPRDVAVDSSGNVYTAEWSDVLDTHRIQKFDSQGRFLESWGTWGQGNGQFLGPRAIAIDSEGDVYVIDLGNSRVQVFDSKGKFLRKWGTQGDGDAQLKWPEGIDVDRSGNVYVLDTWNYRIQVFDSKGKFLRKWGIQGDGDGEFDYPNAIAVDSRAHKVYVADTNNCRIQVFDTKGNFLAKWGTYGAGDMELSGPCGIAISRSGDVYVADTANHRIKVYRPVGGGAVEPRNKKPVKWGYLKRTELLQNFPNPFNPETWIPFNLSEPEHVKISIYTSTGQLVKTIDLGQKSPGAYFSKEKAAYWDGRNETGETVASDVYFYAMEAGDFIATRKMVVMR